MWVAQDQTSRLEGAAVALPERPPPPSLYDEVRQAEGPMAEFFQRLAKVLMPSLVPNRQALAVALAALNPLPPTLQNVAQQHSAQGATWQDMTAPENVAWAVHPGGSGEPEWPLALVKGNSWEWLEKSALYSTMPVKLVMAACEETFAHLGPAEQREAYGAVCLHFNTAARTENQPARILLSDGPKPWKFDLDPGNIERQYCGQKKRVTKRQRETMLAEGRGSRAMER